MRVTLRVVTADQPRIAVIGTCLATNRELHVQIERAVRCGDYDALTALPGSYHLAVSGPAGVVVFGDVAGFRRVFTTWVGVVAVAASHADVLRRLVGARLRRSLAVILLCRLGGTCVTWRVGFCSPPPRCHAWVEAGGEPVCEIVDPRLIYTPIVTV